MGLCLCDCVADLAATKKIYMKLTSGSIVLGETKIDIRSNHDIDQNFESPHQRLNALSIRFFFKLDHNMVH